MGDARSWNSRLGRQNLYLDPHKVSIAAFTIKVEDNHPTDPLTREALMGIYINRCARQHNETEGGNFE
jgi:hypothetical protein